MKFSVSVEVIYALTAAFLALTVFFLAGKGGGLILGHNTIQKERYSPKKLCRAIGVCFAFLTVFLGITSLFWDILPKWYVYLFDAVTAVVMFAVFFLCHMNVIFRK